MANLPISEKELLIVIEKVVNKLAYGFKFGYHTLEDIKQEARLRALIALPKFDPKKQTLEGFLYLDLKNKLINFKRDNYKRPIECPCQICKNFLNGETLHPDGRYCESYLKWCNKNNKRLNISQPLSIETINDEKEKSIKVFCNYTNQLEIKEIKNKIDIILPVDIRSYYLRMLEGLPVPRIKRKEVESFIKIVLNEVNNV